MGQSGALGATREAGWSSAHTHAARIDQRDLLPDSERGSLAAPAPRFTTVADRLDGLITTDRFCLTRLRARALKLRRERTYAPKTIAGQRSERESDVAGAAYAGGAARWTASVGPVVSASPALDDRSSAFSGCGGERCE
jgi:hypothetical protein